MDPLRSVGGILQPGNEERKLSSRDMNIFYFAGHRRSTFRYFYVLSFLTCKMRPII